MAVSASNIKAQESTRLLVWTACALPMLCVPMTLSPFRKQAVAWPRLAHEKVAVRASFVYKQALGWTSIAYKQVTGRTFLGTKK